MRCRCRFKSTVAIRHGARVVASFTRPRFPSASNAAAWLVQLTTLIAYLKGVCHASFSTIRKFIRDMSRLTISRGQLSGDHRQGE